MAVGTGAPQLVTPRPRIPVLSRVYGLGGIYAKTMRDSRLAFLIMTGLLAGFMLAIGSAWGSAYGTAEAR
jgi:hypothetical protein